MKNFDAWINQKKQIHDSVKKLFCNERDIWWAYLGANVGCEQDGKNGDFVRPVLVLRKFNNQVFLAVPLSTQIKPCNKYYVRIDHGGKAVSSVISQVRLLDTKRLKRKMYRLDKEQYEFIRNRVIKMIGDSV